MGRLPRFLRLIELRRIAAAAIAFAALDACAVDAPDIPGIMRSTVDAWIASQSDGFAPYGYDFLADKPLEPDRMSPSNLIRQIATAFAAARYLEYTGDAQLREPIRRSLSAMTARSIPIGKSRLQRIVESTRILSLPVGRWKLKNALDRFGLLYQASGEGKVVSSNGKYDGALSGAVALALLTEVIYSSASGDETFAAYRRAWLEGLLSLRIPGRGFRQFPISIDDTDYDNGEGWLALAVYVDKHRDDRETAAALEDLDAALLARYSETPTATFFGWGSMAAAQRFATTRDPKFLDYLQRQADLFVGRWHRRMKPEDNNCAILEGAAAMLPVLDAAGEAESNRVRGLRSWSDGEVAKLPRLQIQPGQKGMALGGEAYLNAPAMAPFAGGFLWSLHEPMTRVDAAGHCLSAMVLLDRAKRH
jgi:hypothetical protein